MDADITVTVWLDCHTTANYTTLKARLDGHVPAAGETVTVITDNPEAKVLEYQIRRSGPV